MYLYVIKHYEDSTKELELIQLVLFRWNDSRTNIQTNGMTPLSM